MWVWSRITQRRLDQYRHFHNSHTIRTQKKSRLPTGGTPNDFYHEPGRWGGEDLLVEVPDELKPSIDQLLEKYDRPELTRFVDEEFEKYFADLFDAAGLSEEELTPQLGWNVFRGLLKMHEDIEYGQA